MLKSATLLQFILEVQLYPEDTLVFFVFVLVFFFFWRGDWRLNSGPQGTLPLEPHSQPFLFALVYFSDRI
jgi:hypothetical protein